MLLFANTEWYLYNFRLSLINALRDRGDEMVLVSPPGPYGKKLQDLGFWWIPAPMDRLSLNPWREAKLLIWLTRLLKREQIDLVHGFTIKCAVYGSIAARLAGVPARVNAVAGMGYVFSSDDLKARLLRPWVRLLMRLALNDKQSRLILQNPDDVGIFLRAGLVSEDRIRLIYGSGVNCQRFAPRKKHLNVQPDSNVKRVVKVLLPARLLWDKGIQEFVDAAKILKGTKQPDESNQFEFLLAGDPDLGNPASVPTAVIRGWVSQGLVTWLGHIDDMPTLFNSVDMVVLPSYREGLPKGLIEAGACGCPLITTDVPGCREVVTNEVDGLLVPVKDAGALAEAILRLTNNPDLCVRLANASRKKAVAQFDELVIDGKTMVVYQEVIRTENVLY